MFDRGGSEAATQAVRERVAVQFLNMASRIAEKAGQVEKVVETRLLPVQIPQLQEVKSENKTLINKPADPWPSLFSDARASLWEIERALVSIEANINKTEI
jgi:hypothetical protein